MIWLKVSGNNIMEFYFRYIKPDYNNYVFVNQNFMNKNKGKKNSKKVQSYLGFYVVLFFNNLKY